MKEIDGQFRSERIERHQAGEITIKGKKVGHVPPGIMIVGGNNLAVRAQKLLGFFHPIY